MYGYMDDKEWEYDDNKESIGDARIEILWGGDQKEKKYKDGNI